jgi:hypothetical protein
VSVAAAQISASHFSPQLLIPNACMQVSDHHDQKVNSRPLRSGKVVVVSTAGLNIHPTRAQTGSLGGVDASKHASVQASVPARPSNSVTLPSGTSGAVQPVVVLGNKPSSDSKRVDAYPTYTHSFLDRMSKPKRQQKSSDAGPAAVISADAQQSKVLLVDKQPQESLAQAQVQLPVKSDNSYQQGKQIEQAVSNEKATVIVATATPGPSVVMQVPIQLQSRRYQQHEQSPHQSRKDQQDKFQSKMLTSDSSPPSTRPSQSPVQLRSSSAPQRVIVVSSQKFSKEDQAKPKQPTEISAGSLALAPRGFQTSKNDSPASPGSSQPIVEVSSSPQTKGSQVVAKQSPTVVSEANPAASTAALVAKPAPASSSAVSKQAPSVVSGQKSQIIVVSSTASQPTQSGATPAIPSATKSIDTTFASTSATPPASNTAILLSSTARNPSVSQAGFVVSDKKASIVVQSSPSVVTPVVSDASLQRKTIVASIPAEPAVKSSSTPSTGPAQEPAVISSSTPSTGPAQVGSARPSQSNGPQFRARKWRESGKY